MAKTKEATQKQTDVEQKQPSRSLAGTRTEGDRERALEILKERHTHAALSFDAMMRQSHLIVPPEHPTHQQLQSPLKQAAQTLGLESSNPSLVLFARYPEQHLETISYRELDLLKPYLPEAFVNPVSGTVYLNLPLLEALKYDSQKINSVIYHELAHLVTIRGVMKDLVQSTDDPLGMSFRDYDVEYHCDRIAALVSSKHGEDPRSIGQALRALEAFERDIIDRTKLKDYATPTLELPLLSTHPATPRRIRANERVSHQLPAPPAQPISQSPIPSIDIQTLPVTRPYGEVFRIKNSFGNEGSGVGASCLLDSDRRPSKLVLGSDDYRAWCGKFRESEDDELIPCTIEELLTEPSVNRVSDWLFEFSTLAEQPTETLMNVVDEFLVELATTSLVEVTTILKNINLSRILKNFREPYPGSTLESTLPFCVSPLLGRYLELQASQGAGSLDSLRSLVEIAREQELLFGTSIVYEATEVKALIRDICQNGSESEQKDLVELISRNPSLPSKITVVTTTAPGAKPQKSDILKPLLKKYSPLRIERKHSELSRYSMCVEIVPLHEDDAIRQPTILRRVPGAEFAIETLQYPGLAQPLMMIKIGDSPLSDENVLLIQEAFQRRFTDQFQLRNYSRHINNTLSELLEVVRMHAPKLLGLPVLNREEIEQFMAHQLAVTCAENRTITGETLRVGRELYNTGIRKIFVATSITDQIYHSGTDETIQAWTGPDRSTYSATSYTRPESSSFDLFQASLLFADVHRLAFDAMPPSTGKADFLLSKLPLKTLERDQLICEALGYPALNCLNDMTRVEHRVMTETDIHALHILRESFQNQGLAHVAEARLHELCTQDINLFLGHPTITAIRSSILRALPETVQEVAVRDDRLLGILSAFTKPSRQRDKRLREFIDRANSRSLKEGLGSLLVDPIISKLSPTVDGSSRVSLDTIFSLLPYLSPYDKAQTLLYFMGSRDFVSPTATWLLGDYDGKTPIPALQKNLPLQVPKRQSIPGLLRHAFELPDCLVRAQKTFGISVATAENLQSSLLNERGITDLLTTVLYEESGIVHDAKVRQEFFLLAGRTLVQTSARLKTLEASQKKQLAQFIAFAFEQCPQEKLPTVIMRVWEATKGDAKQLPSILASILTGLGPAFVKFGQRLATSNIDADYKRACRQLSSENTEVDSTLFYHNTEAIFGTPTFDSERSGHKLGEGSMAAAFTAVPLGSDKLVAIKIIQPAIESEIESDCVFIQKLVEYINTNKPFGLLTLPANTANKIRQQLKHQIDTEREIANSKALSSALSSGTAMVNFRVPEVDEQFSPRGVIVSEYLPGYELDKHEIDQQGYKSTTLRNEVGLEAMRLLLTAPVYQSDVNYGNFGALKDPATGEIVLSDGRPTVIWYDAGAVEQISIDDQKLLLTIIKSAMTDPSLLPQQLCRLVKNSEEGSAILADICQDFKNEWAGGRSFAPSILKERFERFFDKVSERGLEVEERWLIVANTISMAAPLLEGVSSDRLKELIVDALNHHDMLSFTERVALSARSWFS